MKVLPKSGEACPELWLWAMVMVEPRVLANQQGALLLTTNTFGDQESYNRTAADIMRLSQEKYYIQALADDLPLHQLVGSVSGIPAHRAETGMDHGAATTKRRSSLSLCLHISMSIKLGSCMHVWVSSSLGIVCASA